MHGECRWNIEIESILPVWALGSHKDSNVSCQSHDEKIQKWQDSRKSKKKTYIERVAISKRRSVISN
jgi:hypothetical protein